MNFPIFATLFLSSLIAGSILDIRQDDCVVDQCFLAVWGDLDLDLAVKAITDCQSYVTTSLIVFPTETITIIAQSTSTATIGCSLTSIEQSMSLSPSETAIFPEPTKTSHDAMSDWSTSTSTGQIPPYATSDCQPTAYVSACSCEGITQSDITYITTMETTSVTYTFNQVVVTSVPCSTDLSSSVSTQSTLTLPLSSVSASTKTTSSQSTSSLAVSTSTSGGSTPSASSSILVSISGVSSASKTDTTTTASLESSFNTLSSKTSGLSSLSTYASNSSRTCITTLSSLSNTESASATSGITTVQSSSASASSTSAQNSGSSSSSPSASVSSFSGLSSRSSISTNSAPSLLSEVSSVSASRQTTSTTISTVSTTSTTASTSTSKPDPSICVGPGVNLCGSSCFDTKNDVNHCGSCDNSCSAQQACINGVCASKPCDSRCGWDRTCGTRNGTVACICASTFEGHGVCFDSMKYQCDGSSTISCEMSAVGDGGCPVGSACVKDYCRCGSSPASGICVKTDGCGDRGNATLGSFIRLGEMERRRRMVNFLEN